VKNQNPRRGQQIQSVTKLNSSCFVFYFLSLRISYSLTENRKQNWEKKRKIQNTIWRRRKKKREKEIKREFLNVKNKQIICVCMFRAHLQIK